MIRYKIRTVLSLQRLASVYPDLNPPEHMPSKTIYTVKLVLKMHEIIFMVSKVFEPLKFDGNYTMFSILFPFFETVSYSK